VILNSLRGEKIAEAQPKEFSERHEGEDIHLGIAQGKHQALPRPGMFVR